MGSYVFIVTYRIILEISCLWIAKHTVSDSGGEDYCLAFILADATALFTRKERRSIPAIIMEV
jgi:hypothetical protein